MKDELLANGFAPERIEIFPPVPRPGDALRSSFSDRNLLIYAGQIIHGKGVDVLLRAPAKVRGRFETVILGDGNQRRSCGKLGRRPFDSGGIKDWLHNGVNGYLVPWMDTDRYAARIDELLENKDLARTMGERGLELVSRDYDFEAYLERLEDLFSRMEREPIHRRKYQNQHCL